MTLSYNNNMPNANSSVAGHSSSGSAAGGSAFDRNSHHRTSLIDQKRAQWAKEQAEQSEWSPWGKPGSGAPLNKNRARTQVQRCSSTGNLAVSTNQQQPSMRVPSNETQLSGTSNGLCPASQMTPLPPLNRMTPDQHQQQAPLSVAPPAGYSMAMPLPMSAQTVPQPQYYNYYNPALAQAGSLPMQHPQAQYQWMPVANTNPVMYAQPLIHMQPQPQQQGPILVDFNSTTQQAQYNHSAQPPSQYNQLVPAHTANAQQHAMLSSGSAVSSGLTPIDKAAHPQVHAYSSTTLPSYTEQWANQSLLWNEPTNQTLPGGNMTKSQLGQTFGGPNEALAHEVHPFDSVSAASSSVGRRRKTEDDPNWHAKHSKELAAKLSLDEHVLYKQRQERLMAEREQMENLRIEHDRQMLERRAEQQNANETHKWKLLQENEQKREEKIVDAWEKARREAAELKRQRIHAHALQAQESNGHVQEGNRDQMGMHGAHTAHTHTTLAYADLALPSLNSDTDTPASSSRSKSVSVPSNQGSVSPTGVNEPSHPNAYDWSVCQMSGRSEHEERPIRPAQASPLELWDAVVAANPSLRASRSSTAQSSSPSPKKTVVRRSVSVASPLKQAPAQTQTHRPTNRKANNKPSAAAKRPPRPRSTSRKRNSVKQRSGSEPMENGCAPSTDESSSTPVNVANTLPARRRLVDTDTASNAMLHGHVGGVVLTDTDNPFTAVDGNGNKGLLQPVRTRSRRARAQAALPMGVPADYVQSDQSLSAYTHTDQSAYDTRPSLTNEHQVDLNSLAQPKRVLRRRRLDGVSVMSPASSACNADPDLEVLLGATSMGSSTTATATSTNDDSALNSPRSAHSFGFQRGPMYKSLKQPGTSSLSANQKDVLTRLADIRQQLAAAKTTNNTS